MITDHELERIRGWFAGRLPEAWQAGPVRVSVDREEITVVLGLPDVGRGGGDGTPSAVEQDEARAGRARAFREETRELRMEIDREAQRRFDRKVSWGVNVGGREELWTNVAAPVMTRLRQPQRQVLDTLVASGVARSRSDVLADQPHAPGQREEDWLADLRAAMHQVADVRSQGPMP